MVNTARSKEGRLFHVGGGIADSAAACEDLVAFVAWQRAVSRRAFGTFVLWRAGVAGLSAGVGWACFPTYHVLQREPRTSSIFGRDDGLKTEGGVGCCGDISFRSGAETQFLGGAFRDFGTGGYAIHGPTHHAFTRNDAYLDQAPELQCWASDLHHRSLEPTTLLNASTAKSSLSFLFPLARSRSLKSPDDIGASIPMLCCV